MPGGPSSPGFREADDPVADGEEAELGDACLELQSPDPVTGNDVAADGKSIVIITGANSGGKSTFLRSVGVS